MKSKRAQAEQPALIARQPSRRRIAPSWRLNSNGTMQHSVHSISAWLESIEEGRIRLPVFQRPWVWTDEQIRRFLESIVNGFHVGNLLVWRRYDAPAWSGFLGELKVDAPIISDAHGCFIVIDGQQRLGALATASFAERFKFDLSSGSVRIEPCDVPWHVPFSLLMTSKGISRVIEHECCSHAQRHGLDEEDVRDLMIEAMALVTQSCAVGAVEIPARWSIERVIESFRRINTEGTQMDPEMLQAGILRALDCKDAAVV